MPSEVYVDSYLTVPHATPPTVEQDTAAIQAAINDVSNPVSANYGAAVLFQRTYLVGGATITVPSNVTLRGDGRRAKVQRYNTTSGPVFQVAGAPGAFAREVRFENLVLDGANSPNDLIDISYCLYARLIDCYFVNTAGRFLKLTAVFDSWIERCDFVGGGNGTAQVPVVELASPDNCVCNNIRFTGCRWETSHWSPLKIGGLTQNTNNIMLSDCKMESNSCSAPYIDAENMNGLMINGGMFYFAAGSSPAVISLKNARGILGRFTLGAARGATLTNFILFDAGSGAAKLDIYVNDLGGSSTIPPLASIVGCATGLPPCEIEASVKGYTFDATPCFSATAVVA